MNRKFRAGAAIVLCALLVVPVAAGLAATPWPKTGYDLKNTGQSPYTGAQAVALKWNYTTGGQIQYSSPVLGPDGTIYIGNYGDNNVYALNPDGTLRWNYSTGGGIVASPTIGPGGTIYFGNTGPDTKLYALNPDGTLKWSYTTGGAIYNTPAIGTDGTIYFGNYGDHYLYALNPDGTLLWRYYSGGSAFYLYGSPVIGSDGTLYIGLVNTGDQNSLLALNPDGNSRWKYHTGTGRIYGSAATGADGTICFGSDDSQFYVLNPDGTLKWTYLSGGAFKNPSPAIGADGTIYIGNAGDGRIYALNRDGTLTWTFPTGGIKSWGSPAIGADGTLYVGSTDGRIYALTGVLDFTADQTRISSPFEVQFTGISALASTSWSWDFGDGSASTQQNPSHAYPSAGTYTVRVTTTNPSGTNTLTKTEYLAVPPESATMTPGNAGFIPLTMNLTSQCSRVQAAPLATTEILPMAPQANFTADRTWGAGPLTVRFTDTSTGSPRTWSWDFGDGNTSVRQNPAYTYPNPGNYSVTLTAKNRGGSSSRTLPASITVLPKVVMPVPQFSLNTRSGVVPLWVQFSDTSNGPGITGWAWDFDNNGIIDSTDKDPVCVYTRPGNYTVNLTVTNPFGTRTVSREDVILAESLAPAVFFTANRTAGDQPLVVRFKDRSTGPGITEWAWDFNNDGIIDSTDKDTDCVYARPGNYTVSLTVTNTSGSRTVRENDLIRVKSLAPVADFIANKTTGIPPLAVRFSDISTGANSTGWAWDFNSDGIIDSTDKDPDCVYNKPGNYTVSLTTTNAYGTNTTSRMGSVTVTNGVTIDFTANQTTGIAPFTVRFNDTSTGTNITGWTWDFDSNEISDSTDQNPVCVYTRPGIYSISLSIQNTKGSGKKIKKEFIHVRDPAPEAGFSANSTAGIPPLAVQFHDTSSGTNITGWIWDFNNDGVTDSTEQNPVCVYNQFGNATVRLVVTNRYGSNSTTREDLITVSRGVPRTRFAVNVTTGFAPLSVQFKDISEGQNITGWAWDFDSDGVTDSTDQNPSCVYNLPGNYGITFTATNAYGSERIVRKGFVKVT